MKVSELTCCHQHQLLCLGIHASKACEGGSLLHLIEHIVKPSHSRKPLKAIIDFNT